MSRKDNEFPPSVKNSIIKRAAYICSNPDCRVLCIAPAERDLMKWLYIGKVAHITAASEDGPRYDPSMTEEKRKDINNAIFLCSNCADMIDKNSGMDYSVDQLNGWKETHDSWVQDNLNKGSKDIIKIAGIHLAEGEGEVIGLHIKRPSQIEPGTVVKAIGRGNITGTKID